MPQVVTNGIKPNSFFKEGNYNLDESFQLYIQKIPSHINYILLVPVYSKLDLSTINFDPLSFFSNPVLHDLYTGDLKIIFDCSTEVSHIDFPYFKQFLNSFKTKGYDFSNFYYLTGDGIEKTIHSNYSNVYHVNILDNFFKNIITQSSNNTKEYFFSCLNRKPRYWRSKLIYLIQSNEFLKSKALCSHPKIHSRNQISNHTGFDVEDSMVDFFIKSEALQASNIFPLVEDMPYEQLISHLPEVYSRVVFDVAMEAYQEGTHQGISEKTFKPIVNSIPLIIWGTPGANTTQLTNLGFKCYDDWFDLSFDSETNTEKRMHLLLKEISRICVMLEKFNASELIAWQRKNTNVIEHNKNILVNLLPSNVSEFDRLYEDLHVS